MAKNPVPIPVEKKRRSIAKAISWRFFATLITSSIVYVLTGRFEFAATVGVIDTLIKIFVYYAHERVWANIAFGKPQQPEYQI